LIVIAHLKNSKDKGKGRAPSNLIDGLEDDVVPHPKASFGYDELLTPEGESDDGDSDFEASEPDYEDEDEDEDGRVIPLRNTRKLPLQRTSHVDIRHFDEEVEDIMFAAATEASIRDMMGGGASTSASSSSCNVPWGATLATTTEYYNAGSEVVPDSEPEDELLMVTYPEDEPVVVPTGRMSLGKGRGRNKVHGKPEFDANSIHHDVISARREARRGSRLEKQEIRMLEYQLGRRLTYVGLAGTLCALISAF
jgi:hypothetical protein